MFGIKKLKQRVQTLNRIIYGRFWPPSQGLVEQVRDLESRAKELEARPTCNCMNITLRIHALECLQKHGEHLWRFDNELSCTGIKFRCFRCGTELWQTEKALTPAQRAELERLGILT